jgi:hypothetical protein
LLQNELLQLLLLSHCWSTYPVAHALLSLWSMPCRSSVTSHSFESCLVCAVCHMPATPTVQLLAASSMPGGALPLLMGLPLPPSPAATAAAAAAPGGSTKNSGHHQLASISGGAPVAAAVQGCPASGQLPVRATSTTPPLGGDGGDGPAPPALLPLAALPDSVAAVAGAKDGALGRSRSVPHPVASDDIAPPAPQLHLRQSLEKVAGGTDAGAGSGSMGDLDGAARLSVHAPKVSASVTNKPISSSPADSNSRDSAS